VCKMVEAVAHIVYIREGCCFSLVCTSRKVVDVLYFCNIRVPYMCRRGPKV
jgi:hypothetical protein